MGFGKRKKYMLQTYGNESLKKVSEKVTVFDRELNELANSMTRAMHELNGIGLAAVQIGVHKRLVIIDVPQSSMSTPPTPGELQLLPQMPIALVNPEIIEKGSEIVSYDEGGLSVPDLYAPVDRPRLIKVRAWDLTGQSFEFECGGLLARCIQHEVDHLDGFLFVDRLSEEEGIAVAGELEAVKRRGRKFNYQRDIKA